MDQRPVGIEVKVVEEKVGILLAVGVFFMPWVFCWATARRKHTPLARIVSFAWAMFWVVFFAAGALRRARAETRAVVAFAEHAAAEQGASEPCER